MYKKKKTKNVWLFVKGSAWAHLQLDHHIKALKTDYQEHLDSEGCKLLTLEQLSLTIYVQLSTLLIL